MYYNLFYFALYVQYVNIQKKLIFNIVLQYTTEFIMKLNIYYIFLGNIQKTR